MTTAIVTAPTEERRRTTHRRAHPHCFACGEEAEGALGLRFRVGSDDSVTANWICPAAYRSYDGLLHGGLIATLLDSAMVHALFARGIVARTADLQVRYRHPVRTGVPADVAARLRSHCGPLYCLAAEMRQQGAVCATARAKFMAGSSLGSVAAGLPADQTSPCAMTASSPGDAAPATTKWNRP